MSRPTNFGSGYQQGFEGSQLLPPKAVATTTYTFAVADCASYVQFSNAAAITVTVPPQSSVPIDIGKSIIFEQTGAGAVTIAAGAGVTLNGGTDATSAQFDIGILRKTGLNTWTLAFAGTGGGGGAPTFTLTASGNIAAGSAVSVNSSGQAVQTWGPAPNIAGVVTLISATIANNNVTGIVAGFGDGDNFLGWVYGNNGSSVAAITSFVRSGTALTPGTVNSTDFVADGLSLVIPLAFPNLIVVGAAVGPAVIPAAVSGGAIVPAASLGTLSAGPLCGRKLSSTAYVVVTTDGNAVAGTTTAIGSPVQIGSGNIGSAVVDRLTNTTFAVIYVDEANTNTVTGVVGTVGAGNSITFGTPVALSGAANAKTLSQPLELSATSIAAGWSEAIGGAEVLAFLASAATITGTVLAWGAVRTVSTFAQPPQTSFVESAGEIPLFAAAVVDATHVSFGAGSVLPQICTISGGNNLSVPTPIPLTNIGVPITAAASGAGLITQPAGGFPYADPSTLIINSIVPITQGLMVSDATSRVYEVDGSGNQSPSIQHAGLWNYGLTTADATDAVAWFFDFNNNFQARVIVSQAINVSPPIGITALGATSGNPVTIQNAGAVTGLSGLTQGSRYYSNGDGTLTTANTGHLMGTAISATAIAANVSGP